MEVPPIGQNLSGSSAFAGQSESLQAVSARNAFTAARKLNSLNITDREFTVVRDSASQQFKIVVRDASTGAVLDQFPAEDILQMLAQLSPADRRNTGETPE